MIVEIFIVAFLASALAAQPILWLLVRLKSRQTVSNFAPEGHQQKQGTPTMGGLIVAVGFIFASVSTLGFIGEGDPAHRAKHLVVVFLFVGFALIGFIDDYLVPRLFVGKRGLGWKQKIVMQLVVAVACAYLMNDGGWPTTVGVVFFILFFSNAYNFADGLDGMSALLLIALGGGLAIIAHLRGIGGIELYLVALIGGSLPFLNLNKPRAKVFMGDVGSLPIGAILGLAVASIALPRFLNSISTGSIAVNDDYYNMTQIYGQPPSIYIALLLISGVMIAELVPVPLQILSVKLRKKKLFSYTPIHHAFELKGWSQIKVMLVFVAWQCGLSLAAIAVVLVDTNHVEGSFFHFFQTKPAFQDILPGQLPGGIP